MKSRVSPEMDFLQPLLGQPGPGLNHALWETFFLIPASSALAPACWLLSFCCIRLERSLPLPSLRPLPSLWPLGVFEEHGATPEPAPSHAEPPLWR